MKTNTILNTEPVLYEFDKIEDKHYFAGLLNMAELNFRIALQETGQRTEKSIKKKVIKNSSEANAYIKTLFKENITQSDWNYRTEILSEFLPVIKALNPNADKAAFIQTLSMFSETLNNLRNFYTHYYHPKIEINQSLFELLDKLLFTSVIHVKKQRLKTDANKVLLPKQYEDDLKKKLIIHNQKCAEKYAYERRLPKNINKTQKEFDKEFNKKNKIYNERDFVNTYLNATLHDLIFKDKNGHEQLKETSRDGEQFSKNGFIFFLSFFIDRKNLDDLLNHTENFRGNHELRFMVTRWVFSSYVFKDVRRVLRSDYTNDALLLQMIGELNKCPKELFDILATEHQLEFFEDNNEYYKDNEENDETLSNSLVVHNVWRKRYDDKFAYFALRFLDEFAGFSNLKFQIVLGNYIHDSRPKELQGINMVTERAIKEKIKVFGKLSEIDKLKKDYFIRKTKERNEPEANVKEIDESADGWEEYPIAHYKLDNNNIPIYLHIQGFTKQTTPKKERVNRLSKKNILEQLTDNGFIDSEPIAFLSINELPALLYEILVKKKSPKDIENILFVKIVGQINTIKKFDDRSEVNKHKIPKRLIQLASSDAGAGKINFLKLLKDITIEINKCDSKLREGGEILNNSRQKRFNNKQRGEIAVWLADDIKRFAGKEIRENWKSHQHAELQALLAFYTDRKEDIKLLLEKEIGLPINSNRILQASFAKNNLEDFYEIYLETREKVLTEYKIKIENKWRRYHEESIKKEIDKVFDFFDKRLYISSTIETYKNELLQKPVNLPRGVFDTDNYRSVQKGDENNFQPWFEIASQKETYQEFYNFPRQYDTIQLDPLSGKGLLAQNENRPVPSDVLKNEKRLREIARQDFYVLEMVKYILGNMHSSIVLSKDYLLKDLFQTKKEKNRIKERAKQQSQKEVGDKSESIIDESHLLLRRFETTIKIGDIKITDTVALKEIGKFNRLGKDTRIATFISYSEKDAWTKQEIEDQIDNYEKIRKELFFKEVHLLEENILQKAWPEFPHGIHPPILQQDNHPNFKYYIAYHFLKDDTDVFNDFVKRDFRKKDDVAEILATKNPTLLKALFLVLLRNNFAHNQLPDKEVYLKMSTTIKLEGNKIGDYLLRVFKESVVQNTLG